MAAKREYARVIPTHDRWEQPGRRDEEGAMAITMVDITSGQLQKVLAYLEAEAHYLATPPELRSIFPPNFAFDFSRIRVSVQLKPGTPALCGSAPA
jgi:hypothetical protein